MRFAGKIPFLAAWGAGIATAGVVAAATGLFVLLGGYDIAADRQHPKVVAWALHTTMTHSVKLRARNVRVPASSRADVLAGARFYQAHCIACHGGPSVARAPWASALVPTPPYLLGASRRWSKAELFTIVHGGVKMTAMPAWGEVASDRDIWNVVAFLEALPNASPRADQQLRSIMDGATAEPEQRTGHQPSQSTGAARNESNGRRR